MMTSPLVPLIHICAFDENKFFYLITSEVHSEHPTYPFSLSHCLKGLKLKNRGVSEGEVDTTCVQFGSRGKRIAPSRGEEFPQIYGSY